MIPFSFRVSADKLSENLTAKLHIKPEKIAHPNDAICAKSNPYSNE
jgi:hypothetical protein